MLRRDKRKNVYSPLTENMMESSELTSNSPTLQPTLSISMLSLTNNNSSSVMSPVVSTTMTSKSNSRFMNYNRTSNNNIIVSPRVHFWCRTTIPAVGYAICTCIALILILGPKCTRHFNTALCIMIGLSLLSTLFRRAAIWAFNEPGRITYNQILPTFDVIEFAPRTLRARTCLYCLLADFIFLPMCLAISIFREVNEVMLFGSWMLPPSLSSRIPFMCLFATLPLFTIVVCYIFYIRFLLYDRLDFYQNTSRRASSLPSMLALLSSVIIIPALLICMSAFPCENGYMRFAITVKCQSFTHRLSMFVALLLLALLMGYMELTIGSFRVIADDAIDSSSAANEVRNDLLTLELLYIVRLFTIFSAVLQLQAMRCMLLMLISSLVLLRLCLCISSTVWAVQHVMKGAMISLFASSAIGFVVYLVNLEDSYGGVALWAVVWLITVNTLIIIYIERHGCALFERREDSRTSFSSV